MVNGLPAYEIPVLLQPIKKEEKQDGGAKRERNQKKKEDGGAMRKNSQKRKQDGGDTRKTSHEVTR
jgi:hypothetical protein